MAAVRAGYIHYLVGQVETMEMSQARVVSEGLCPVWVEGRAIEKGFKCIPLEGSSSEES